MIGKGTLVAGAPCSGKNTYVSQHAAPGDLIVDYDAIMAALSGQDEHEHEDAIKPYVYEARDRVITKWLTRKDVDLWVIYGAPKRADREWYMRRGFRVVIMDTDERTCIRRARDTRPAHWHRFIRRWFNDYQAPLTTEQVEQASDEPAPAHVSRRW